MGGGPSRPAPVDERVLDIVYFEEVIKNIPLKSIIERQLSKLDKRQQWQIVLNNNKKTFKLKNVENNTYLYIGLDPTDSIPEFATIDLDKDNYKYDPAYVGISNDEIENKTGFSFISSFGTQLDIIDRNDSDIEMNKAILKSIKSSRVRITTQLNEHLNIFGVFIYGPNENVLNTNENHAYSSSNYQNQYPARNAIKIVRENLNRKAYDAIQNKPLNGKQIEWNNIEKSSNYLCYTDKDNTGVGGGSWWEYEFDDPIDIALVEIFGRTDMPDRNKLRIDLFDDSKSRTNVIFSIKFDDMKYDAHKVIKYKK